MKDLVIENLTIKTSQKNIFENFQLTVKADTVTGILGPSGCGKTTLLNWIAGLLPADFIASSFSNSGKISYVFQEPRLIPNLSVLENVILPVKKKYGKEKSLEIAEKYLEKVELLNKKNEMPDKLSGGEKQRVSIARAFAYDGDLLLLDEPLQSLDKELRQKLLELIKNLLNEKPKTVIFVSHYEEELQFLCDTIVRLN